WPPCSAAPRTRTRTCERSPLISLTCLLLDRFLLPCVHRFRQDLALIDTVERRPQFRPGAGTDDVAADVFQERELRRTGVERHEVDLHRALALGKDIPSDGLRIAAARVLPVGDDEQVLAEDAGAIERRPRIAHRVTDGRTAARMRERGERRTNPLAIV